MAAARRFCAVELFPCSNCQARSSDGRPHVDRSLVQLVDDTLAERGESESRAGKADGLDRRRRDRDIGVVTVCAPRGTATLVKSNINTAARIGTSITSMVRVVHADVLTPLKSPDRSGGRDDRSACQERTPRRPGGPIREAAARSAAAIRRCRREPRPGLVDEGCSFGVLAREHESGRPSDGGINRSGRMSGRCVETLARVAQHGKPESCEWVHCDASEGLPKR